MADKIRAIMERNQGSKQPSIQLKPKSTYVPKHPQHIVGRSKGDKPHKQGDIPPFIDARDFTQLEFFLKTPPAKVEIEVSFGFFNNTGRGIFYEPITVKQFNSILSYLISLAPSNMWGDQKMPPELIITTESSESDGRKSSKGQFKKLRRIIDSLGTTKWLEKGKRDNIDSHTWGYRISKSSERAFANSADEILNLGDGETIDMSNFKPDFTRYKERRTFYVVDRNSELYGLKFDLTRVKEVTSLKGDNVKIKYEIEIERSETVTATAFVKAIGLMIRVMQKADDETQLMTMPERERVTEIHNNLFARDDRGKRYDGGSFCLTGGYENKPENIKDNDLINPENKFSVTIKINGVRGFLFISDGGMYLCSPPRDILKVGVCKDLNGTLLDVEVYTHPETSHTTYYAFDILFDKGKDVRNTYFIDSSGRGGGPGRLTLLNKVCSSIKSGSLFSGATIEPKVFYGTPNFYENVKLALNDITKANEQGIETDGLICQSHVFYKNRFTKKWKPSNDLTIDLKFVTTEKKGMYKLMAKGTGNGNVTINMGCTQENPRYVPFTGSKENPVEEQIVTVKKGIIENIPNSAGILMSVIANDAILECRWDGANFIPIRYRDDKEDPNFQGVAADVWDDIVRPMSEETIRGDSLIAMRRFHNLVKKHFLSKEFGKGDTIMDWGSGRGGDIKKWKDLGLSKVYIVEPNEENFAELKRRQESFEKEWLDRAEKGPHMIPMTRKAKGKTQLFGAEETELLVDRVGEELKGIVSFFSLTFFGKDREMFDKMIDSIDQLLPIGGKFLGIVMDGDRTQKLLESDAGGGAGEGLLYDCPAFAITQSSKFTPGKIKKGKNEIEIVIKESTSMVDQTEWLFYFGVLQESLEKIGFELKYDGFLDGEGSPLLALGGKGKERRPAQIFDTLPDNGKTFSSLNRYFMFVRKSRKGSPTKKVSPTKTEKKVHFENPKKTPHKKSKDAKLDHRSDLPFDFSKTIWEGKEPKGKEQAFFRIQPVPAGTPYGFIHAVLFAISTKYRLLDIQNREEYVKKVVSMMARKITLDLYRKITQGTAYDAKGKESLARNISDEDLEIQMVEFQLALLEGSSNENIETYADILSHLVGINIFIMKPSRNRDHGGIEEKDVIQLDDERGTFGCFDNSIVVYSESSKLGPEHEKYWVVSNGNDKVFNAYKTRSPFIQHLVKTIAKSRKLHGASFAIFDKYGKGGASPSYGPMKELMYGKASPKKNA